MSAKELVDLTLFYFGESPSGLAIKVGEDESEAKAVWLPKSQVEYEVTKRAGIAIVEVVMPSWLAAEKKFAGF
jgi:hypothetical protein